MKRSVDSATFFFFFVEGRLAEFQEEPAPAPNLDTAVGTSPTTQKPLNEVPCKTSRQICGRARGGMCVESPAASL